MIVDEIFRVFEQYGAEQYLGEQVSMTEHMLQSAWAARQDGAPPLLVAAALLHDYGHFIHGLPEDSAEHGVDTQHEEVAYRFLAEHFGEEIAEPIRLHVAAKRYLCATEPGYSGLLSAESVRTLALQGGPMTPERVTAFEALPYARDAVAVRRWDDEAKDLAVTPPEFAHFAALLTSLTGSGTGR